MFVARKIVERIGRRAEASLNDSCCCGEKIVIIICLSKETESLSLRFRSDPCSRSLPTSPLKVTIKNKKMKNYQNSLLSATVSWMIHFMTNGLIFTPAIFPRIKKLLELACGTGIQSIRSSRLDSM